MSNQPPSTQNDTSAALLANEAASSAAPSQKHPQRGASKYYNDEPRCCQGIPLSVPIPVGDDLCPWLGERRGSFYRLLDQQTLFRQKTTGLKEGVASVYGPSVCDAKYGCRCGHRKNLEWLRSQAKSEVAS
jgi:hypothetical protein